MGHLISISTPCTLSEAFSAILAAHDYLATHASGILRAASEFDPHGNWGGKIKRKLVQLDATTKPSAVATPVLSHSLIEVINQCATVERLMDVLLWAKSEKSGFSDYKVLCCHPTTSSRGLDGELEHDLVLTGPSEKACFEVSDVASTRDGNRKLPKELGRVMNFGEAADDDFGSGTTRRFLAVSAEFCEYVWSRSRAWQNRNGVIFLAPLHVSDTTRIVEVVPL